MCKISADFGEFHPGTVATFGPGFNRLFRPSLVETGSMWKVLCCEPCAVIYGRWGGVGMWYVVEMGIFVQDRVIVKSAMNDPPKRQKPLQKYKRVADWLRSLYATC